MLAFGNSRVAWLYAVVLLLACGSREEGNLPVRTLDPIILNIEGECPDYSDIQPVVVRSRAATQEIRNDSATVTVAVVRHPSRLPLPGVQVAFLADTIERRIVFAGMTDARGALSFTDVKPGAYWIKLISIGYPDTRGFVDVRAGTSNEIFVKMPELPIGCTPRPGW